MSTSTTILIGDLLVRGEMTTAQAMADAVPIAIKTGMPIGRVLVTTGRLSERHLQQALLAQSLIRDSLLSLDIALDALRIVVRESFTLEQALKIVGWQPETFDLENRLGHLLLSAGAITFEELEQALAVFFTAGLPLARVLVLRGAITNLVAYAALSSQQLVREDKLSRDQAVQAVRSAVKSNASIEEDYVNGYLRMRPQNSMRLGELLTLAGMIEEKQLLECVELAMKQGAVLGDVLVERGYLSHDSLNRALDAQRMVTKGQLDVSKAGDVLKKAHYERISTHSALSKHAPATLLSLTQPVEPPSLSLDELVHAKQKDSGTTDDALKLRSSESTRTDQEARVRQLLSRLLIKIDALHIRNGYLAAMLDQSPEDTADDARQLAEFRREAETITDFNGSMECLDKLISKIETFSYHNGYLRAKIDELSRRMDAHTSEYEAFKAAREAEAQQKIAALPARKNSKELQKIELPQAKSAGEITVEIEAIKPPVKKDSTSGARKKVEPPAKPAPDPKSKTKKPEPKKPPPKGKK